MTLEILAKSKGWLYLLLSKIFERAEGERIILRFREACSFLRQEISQEEKIELSPLTPKTIPTSYHKLQISDYLQFEGAVFPDVFHQATIVQNVNHYPGKWAKP